MFPTQSCLCMVRLTFSRSVLCSELAVKVIDEPFISATDDKEEWAL